MPNPLTLIEIEDLNSWVCSSSSLSSAQAFQCGRAISDLIEASGRLSRIVGVVRHSRAIPAEEQLEIILNIAEGRA